MTDYASLVARLHGYNSPDRTVDEHRQMAQDIYDAAIAIEALRADAMRLDWFFGREVNKANWLNEYLRGVRAGWSVDQWRASITAAMAAPPVAGPTDPEAG